MLSAAKLTITSRPVPISDNVVVEVDVIGYKEDDATPCEKPYDHGNIGKRARGSSVKTIW